MKIHHPTSLLAMICLLVSFLRESKAESFSEMISSRGKETISPNHRASIGVVNSEQGRAKRHLVKTPSSDFYKIAAIQRAKVAAKESRGSGKSRCKKKCQASRKECLAKCKRQGGRCTSRCNKARKKCLNSCTKESNVETAKPTRKKKPSKQKKPTKPKGSTLEKCKSGCTTSRKSCARKCKQRFSKRKAKALKRCEKNCGRESRNCVQKCVASDRRKEWAYYRLDTQRHPFALCLDGSPGAYYMRPGAESKKVFIHLQGGGWCSSVGNASEFDSDDCERRAQGKRGSTLNDEAEPKLKNSGLFSKIEKYNPAFWNWTHVFVRYCDGASFLGRRDAPIQTSPPLYSRGNYILRAIIKELFLLKGRSPLYAASHVVVGGGSAGGLSTYLNAHLWRAKLPASTAVAILPDSGFFLEWWGCSAKKTFGALMKNVYELSEAQDSLPQECIQNQTFGSEYLCMFAARVVPTIPVPIFTLHSRFDSFQIEKMLGYKPGTKNTDLSLTEPPTNIHTSSPTAALTSSICLEEISISDANDYGENLTSQIIAAHESQEERFAFGFGSFFYSCSAHVIYLRNDFYRQLTVNGTTVMDAVSAWVDQVFDTSTSPSTGPQPRRLIWLSNEAFPCEDCCPI